MKYMSLLLLSMTLLLAVACDEAKTVPAVDGYFNALTCIDKSSNKCDTDWIISFDRSNYPDTVQIAINDKIVVDDCDAQSYWSKGQTSKYNEYTMHEYVAFDCSKTFKMRVFDRKNCTATRVEHSFNAAQVCANKIVGGKKQIWVEKN